MSMATLTENNPVKTVETFARVLKRIRSYSINKELESFSEAKRMLGLIAGMCREVLVDEGFNPEEK